MEAEEPVETLLPVVVELLLLLDFPEPTEEVVMVVFPEVGGNRPPELSVAAGLDDMVSI